MKPRMSIWFESLLFLSSCPRTVMASEQGNCNSRGPAPACLGVRGCSLGYKATADRLLFVTLKWKFFFSPGFCWLGIDDWHLVLTV